MSKWKIYTPEGVQDILFDECFRKRNLEGKIRELFRTYGCLEVETPTMEFYDVFSAGTAPIPQEKMFKFFDQQGRILVLRPEMTVPIARVTATKYKDAEDPIKYFYICNAFKFNQLGGGKQKEFTEAGVEIVGAGGPEADAEVIAAAINAVKCTGLESFQIDIGQVEFFKGLMEETGLSEDEIEQVRILIDAKDYLGVEELVEAHEIRKDLKELILSIPKLFGSLDVIDRVEKLTFNKRSLKALENLRQVLELLDDYGLSRYVSVDLGTVQSLDYYTGVVFRGFTYDVGFPILSGGRYDRLVGGFGKECSATGFSLGINMIMTALERQGICAEKPQTDSLVCYERAGRKTAFSVCSQLREQGLNVEMDIAGGGLEAVKKYASRKGIGGILYIPDSDSIEVHNMQTGEVSSATIEQLAKGGW
ncbi:ATP phosphoribosyltransferase regulatory subunit [Anaerobacterium chartisolvens]|uniref:ATP phosphoribosyltransferase regulatory subunit n=1 Tax=Anaerobacterium chartisolvens TaxID=1297424 RepID=A0A369AHT9_9FIRM|nr:ATP phosphoribosyltransferase regulatory subunit [Anaerobacterium chartisolvens]RCX08920.1 ATP phosphoribosyltransferase regulatory subunit [Anaerobacterium chartisolvens]